MDYSKMSDFEINCDVANAIGLARHLFFPGNEDEFDDECPLNERGPIWQTREFRVKGYKPSNGNCFTPCNNPADAWPIIVERKINIEWHEWKNSEWMPYALNNATTKSCYGTNPLRAAMIVFLMMQESANVQDNPSR
ncbi:DUF2591 domain-containing protein [Salmonella enterica subsp. enterica]|nr:DUF2591 domain-containing protein [Salmonella enterica subsp. enterica]